MATAATNLNDDALRAALTEKLDEKNPVQIQEPQTPQVQPIVMDLDGESHTFASPTELSAYLKKRDELMVEKVKNHIASLPGEKVTKPNEDDPTQFVPKPDVAKFIKLLEENPVDAFEYVDRFRFGGRSPREINLELESRLATQQAVLTIQQFNSAHPEIGQNPQAVNAMKQVMDAGNLPFTLEGMELALDIAKVRNLIPQAQPTQTYAPPQSTREIGPPALGTRKTGETQDWDTLLQRAEDLDAEEIAQIIQKFS